MKLMRTVAVLWALLPFLAFGQTPENVAKGVRIVVPTPAGGPIDTVARLVATKLRDAINAPVVVDNRAGGLFVPAVKNVAAAGDDEPTMLMLSTSVVIAQALHKDIPYDLLTDLKPITLVATGPLVLVERATLPYRDLRSLLAFAKANPGKLTFASGGGTGSAFYLATELLKRTAKVDMMHVPYKGVAPAMADLLGGHVDLMFQPLVGILPHITSGAVRPLAVTGKTRVKSLPEVPTLAESGLPAVEVTNWFGLSGSAAMSPKTIAYLRQEIAAVLARKEVVEALQLQGNDASPSDPAAFDAFLKHELNRWGAVIKEANIKPD